MKNLILTLVLVSITIMTGFTTETMLKKPTKVMFICTYCCDYVAHDGCRAWDYECYNVTFENWGGIL